MTVAELKKELESWPDDKVVLTEDGGGIGTITRIVDWGKYRPNSILLL